MNNLEMQQIIEHLEELEFYSYEDSSLIPVIKGLQLETDSIWVLEGRYENLRLDISSTNSDLMEVSDSVLYTYFPLPPHRCFSLDQDDIYEYLPTVFENPYLLNVLQRHLININDADEYEDDNGNLYLNTNVGNALICPHNFRSVNAPKINLCWQVVTKNILLMLNKLLLDAGSSEKFYILRQTSEELIAVVMLSPPIFEFLQEIDGSNGEFCPNLS